MQEKPSNLYWSKAHNLLHEGNADLQHFPTPLFQFGKAKQDISLSKRERRRLGIGISLPSIPTNSKGKRVFGIGSHRPRGATRHSDPIHLATLNGEHAFMQMLIKGNAVTDIDCRDGNMATCLHIAVEKNDKIATQMLVEAGAALSLNDYETPLHCAVRMDHTDLVRYLIRQGASLVTKDTNSKSVMDVSIRKIVMNDTFANGVLRPITVQQEEIDYDGTTTNKKKKKKKNKKKKKKKKKKTEQLYEQMRTMSTWDHGKQLLHDKNLHQEKRKNAHLLSRLILKEDLTEAKNLMGNFVSSNEPDPNDYGRSAVTYAAMYSNPSTVEWLVKESGARPSSKDGRIAEQYGRKKSAAFLKNWPTLCQQKIQEQQKQTLQNYQKASVLRSQEANSKNALHFLRTFLAEGKVRHGYRFKKRLIRSLRHLEKCPLGPADDFVELGRVLRDLLPHSWGKDAWFAFQNATIAAKSKENMTKTFGGNVGGGNQLYRLAQQGNQGQIIKNPGQNWGIQKKSRIRKVPPPPPRDYSCLVSGNRHEKEYIPGI